mgnify:CR=1 FL=1
MRETRRGTILVILTMMVALLCMSCDGLVVPMANGTITFDSQEGTLVPSQEATGYINEPNEPTRTGFNFSGWYCDEACTIAWDFDEDLIEGSMTLYAKWEVDNNTVTYHANGADSGEVPYPQIKEPEQELYIADNVGELKKTDYFFTCWNTAADGSGTDYSMGEAYSVEGDLDLYAQWVELKKLIASDADVEAYFAYSVGLDGDTAVLGAFRENNDEVDSHIGSAYIFTRTDGSWSEQAKLVPSDGVAEDGFGWDVSISGDTVVIGSPYADNDNAFDSGAAYVFIREGGTWSEQAKLAVSTGAQEDLFGDAVCISGDTIMVGAPLEDVDDNDTGSVYVFTRSGSSWSQRTKLFASDRETADYFGTAIDISGDTVVIGANGVSTLETTWSGAAYVFTGSGESWSEQAKLIGSDTASFDRFGFSVSIDDDTIVIGAYWDDIDDADDRGSAYVFTREDASWSEQTKLTASDGVSGDYFGTQVSIDGDSIVIGADSDDDKGHNSGSAYIFTRTEDSWVEQTKLIATDGQNGDYFGGAVAIDGDTVLVGASSDCVDDITDSGSAYSYDIASQNL